MNPCLPGDAITVFRQIFGEEFGISAHIISDASDLYLETNANIPGVIYHATNHY